MIEKERKYLIKFNPLALGVETPDEVLYITQYYLKNGLRLRSTEKNDTISYDVNDKRPIEDQPGHSYDDPQYVSEDRFNELLSENPDYTLIIKIRYVKNISNTSKWEIDSFMNLNLTMAEYESDDIDDVTIPDWLSDEIIKDVTGDYHFSNKHLSRTPLK